ncbi:MAG: hypothetical protein FJ388_03115, partial [Verrucomicrobia bacterium]|nr:hypothetical protein [Verrucomicrobiota bacterium]
MIRILFAFLCLHSFVFAALAAVPMSDEIATAKQWIKAALLGDKPGKPFSFVYDGKSSADLLGKWKPG